MKQLSLLDGTPSIDEYAYALITPLEAAVKGDPKSWIEQDDEGNWIIAMNITTMSGETHTHRRVVGVSRNDEYRTRLYAALGCIREEREVCDALLGNEGFAPHYASTLNVLEFLARCWGSCTQLYVAKEASDGGWGLASSRDDAPINIGRFPSKAYARLFAALFCAKRMTHVWYIVEALLPDEVQS